MQLQQLTLGRTCKFIPSPWYKGCGGTDWSPSQSFWYGAVFRNDFAFSGKLLILLTRWGIFYVWWRYWRPVMSPTMVAILDFTKNRPVPSSKNPHFQNEARCTTFLVKMSFICIRMKNDFHIKGWAPTLVLKHRPGGTRKWPTKNHVNTAINVNFFVFDITHKDALCIILSQYLLLLLKELEKKCIFTQKWFNHRILMTPYLVTI